MLKKQLKSIDKALEKFVKELEKESPNVGIIASVPGVGLITTATLYCELPELGKISRNKLAKLVGVAPLTKASGKFDGKRPVRGGRSTVRRVLYMASLVGTQKNPVIRQFYLKLLQKGKPKKLALIACMRKLLLMIHDMVRSQQKWDPQKKANDQAVTNLATGSTCSAGPLTHRRLSYPSQSCVPAELCYVSLSTAKGHEIQGTHTFFGWVVDCRTRDPGDTHIFWVGS